MHWTDIAQRAHGDVVIVDLKGQMTLTGEDEHRLMRAIKEVVQAGHRRVVLNLAQVFYVDSTGIGEIVGAYTRMARVGGTLKLCGVSARTQELFDTTNIGTVIESFATEQDAVGSF
jgi:anti-sigma B factor antagonist